MSDTQRPEAQKPMLAREFSWEMRRTRPETWSRSTRMMQHATELATQFAQPNLERVFSNRDGFGNYVEYVSAVGGLSAALDLLTEYRDIGLSPSIYAVVAMRITRNAGRFDLSAQLLRRAFESSNGDPYVGQFYGSALASNARLEELRDLAMLVMPKIRDRATPRIAERWIELLVDMLLVDVAEELLGSVEIDDASSYVLQRRIESYRDPSSNIGSVAPTYVINLPQETRKFQLSSNLLEAAGHRVVRFDAIIGERLPEVTLGHLCQSQRIRDLMSPGSVAASLSHFKVWETFLASSEDACVVAEDDAGPFVHSEFLTNLLELNDAYDVIYINERMSDAAIRGKPSFLPALEQPWAQLAGWSNARQGWGFDGYVLSRTGAEKALDIAAKIGIDGHVDGQFGAYSSEPLGPPTNHIQRNVLELRKKLEGSETLDGWYSPTPCIKANSFGVSSTVTAGMR